VAAPYILARTLRDAHTFAQQQLGLGRGHYRIVNSVGTIKSVRNADLYLVPGWRNRYDRFAMQSALRWTHLRVIDVAEQPVEAPADPRGPLTEDLLELAYAEDAVRSGRGVPGMTSTDGLEPPGQQLSFDELFSNVGAPAEAAVAVDALEHAEQDDTPAEPEAKEPQVKRRRRRCKDCGILVEPDDVEQHAQDHANDLVAEVS